MRSPLVIAEYPDGATLPVVAWDGRVPLVVFEGDIREATAVGSPTFRLAEPDPADGEGTMGRALAVLRESPEAMRNSDIAKRVEVAPQTCQAALTRLVRNGLVERVGVKYRATRTGPDAAKAVLTELTYNSGVGYTTLELVEILELSEAAVQDAVRRLADTGAIREDPKTGWYAPS